MEHGFTDLVNIGQLQDLMDCFSRAYSISCTVFDPLNETILFLSKDHSIPCIDENNELDCSICHCPSIRESSLSFFSRKEKMRDGKDKSKCEIGSRFLNTKYQLYKCRHDLEHAVFPFVFEGEHLASVIMGPFLSESNVSCEIPAHDIPVISHSEIENMVNRSEKFLDLLVNAGMLNLKLMGYKSLLISNEKELSRSREKVSSLDRMKKELISIFSHELRTPLSIIKGYNELLYDGILGTVCSEQTDALDKSLLSINRLERIVDSLQYIDVSHHESHIYDFLPLNLSDVVETTLVHSTRAMKEKKLKVHTDFPDNMPVIHGDGKKLFHALSYLLDNAIKFSPRGSTISISARKEDDRVCLCIRDNGVGIPEDKLPYIFEAFYQGDSPLTRTQSGIGLGLNICQRIIHCHNGNIRVESRKNEGSAFHIDLPLIAPEDRLIYQAE